VEYGILPKFKIVNDTKLPISNYSEIQKISNIIDCPVEIVQHCMLQIGPSIPAIDAYWQMNKDRLIYEAEQLRK